MRLKVAFEGNLQEFIEKNTKTPPRLLPLGLNRQQTD